MANYCDFEMRITGGEAEIKELISMLRWEGDFKDSGLGRVYSFDANLIEPTTLADVFQVDGFGNCAWSVLTAMQNYEGRTPCLESETERLGLVVEVFSSEPGCQFQEHVLIAKGVVIFADCVDYEEHWIDGAESLEAYNKEYGTDFTEDMVNDNGDVCIGGFGDAYGDFLEVEDLKEYFSPEFDSFEKAFYDYIDKIVEIVAPVEKLERIVPVSVDRLNTLLYNAIVCLEDQGMSGSVLKSELGISDEEYATVMGDYNTLEGKISSAQSMQNPARFTGRLTHIQDKDR